MTVIRPMTGVSPVFFMSPVLFIRPHLFIRSVPLVGRGFVQGLLGTPSFLYTLVNTSCKRVEGHGCLRPSDRSPTSERLKGEVLHHLPSPHQGAYARNNSLEDKRIERCRIRVLRVG